MSGYGAMVSKLVLDVITTVDNSVLTECSTHIPSAPDKAMLCTYLLIFPNSKELTQMKEIYDQFEKA